MRAVVFSRKGFPRKNLCSCYLLIYFLLRYFITSGIRAWGFKIRCPGRLPAALPGQHRAVHLRRINSRSLTALCSFIEVFREIQFLDQIWVTVSIRVLCAAFWRFIESLRSAVLKSEGDNFLRRLQSVEFLVHRIIYSACPFCRPSSGRFLFRVRSSELVHQIDRQGKNSRISSGIKSRGAPCLSHVKPTGVLATS